MRLTLAIRLACLLGCVSAGPIPSPEAASMEEVKVLTYGVIQLHQALQHIYATTQAKMVDIFHALSRHEGALRGLEREAGQAAEMERHIRQAVRLLQAQMAGLQSEAEQTKGRLAHVEQEETALRDAVAKLEAYLHGAALPRIRELQERTDQHSYMLSNLVDWTQNQRRHLQSQEQQLTRLQRLAA